MKRIAPIAALVIVSAPPAPVRRPPSPEPLPPDCAAWGSARFHLLFPEADADLVRLCLRAGTTPLHLGARAREAAFVAALIESGADVNARDAKGRTPLHWAHHNGDPAVVRTLLARGADAMVRRGSRCEPWDPINDGCIRLH